jgi:hypothetical protein
MSVIQSRMLHGEGINHDADFESNLAQAIEFINRTSSWPIRN